MKKLLTGLLVFLSLGAFASNCTLDLHTEGDLTKRMIKKLTKKLTSKGYIITSEDEQSEFWMRAAYYKDLNVAIDSRSRFSQDHYITPFSIGSISLWTNRSDQSVLLNDKDSNFQFDLRLLPLEILRAQFNFWKDVRDLPNCREARELAKNNR